VVLDAVGSTASITLLILLLDWRLLETSNKTAACFYHYLLQRGQGNSIPICRQEEKEGMMQFSVINEH
jgi:hypothetical protein